MIIIDMKVDTNEIRNKYQKAFSKGGEIQRYIDTEVLKGIEPYIPYDEGQLTSSAISNTVIGSGLIIWDTPYAKNLFYGKTKNGQDMVYQQQIHPLAGRNWTERYKADQMETLREGVIRRINKL